MLCRGGLKPASLPCERFTVHGTEAGERLGGNARHSVSDSATVFASVTQMAMDNATLNGLAAAVVMSGCIPHWMKPVLRKNLPAIPPLRWFLSR
ncbi:hypothetical protein LQT60_00010 (plasmid) [Escherichia coli]|nr:hypothetical protein LQT60_00010 [Escherichia coli]